jgi:hypothetical protein
MKKYLIILAALAFFLWNCEEDKLPFYSGDESVYFSEQEINFAFGLFAVMDSVLYLPVTVTGGPIDRDRHFSVVYDSVGGTPDLHFDPLPVEGIVPAGDVTGYLPVSLHRVDGDDAIYSIYARLVPSEDFAMSLKEKYDAITGDTLDVTRLTLTYSSNITKPAYWMDVLYGYFSVAKYLLACELTGRDATFWNNPPSGAAPMAYAMAISTYVNSRILAGRDEALRDPGNTRPADKGFMTMYGVYESMGGSFVPIPAEWEPAD